MAGLCWIVRTCTSYLLHVVSPPSWPHPHHWQPHGGGEGGGGSLEGPGWRTWFSHKCYICGWQTRNTTVWCAWDGRCGGWVCETLPHSIMEAGRYRPAEDEARQTGRRRHHQICQRYGCESCDMFDTEINWLYQRITFWALNRTVILIPKHLSLVPPVVTVSKDKFYEFATIQNSFHDVYVMIVCTCMYAVHGHTCLCVCMHVHIQCMFTCIFVCIFTMCVCAYIMTVFVVCACILSPPYSYS